MSEETVGSSNRKEMVQTYGKKFVPVLLRFLVLCPVGSSEKYVVLLVLNNISIPQQNKRLIALDYGGARLLSKLLCEDPSCHLVAIVLVNLTFVDAETCRDLVSPAYDIQLLDALSFAIIAASYTKAEYESMKGDHSLGNQNPRSPSQRLSQLLKRDQRRRGAAGANIAHVPDTSLSIFARTARWSLCAMKNLTRPSKYANAAAHSLIRTDIVPYVLRFVDVWPTVPESRVQSSNSIKDTLTNSVDPSASKDSSSCRNEPSTWHSHSAQDAALSIVMNLATVRSARDYLRELDAMYLLLAITEVPVDEPKSKHSVEKCETQELQSLRARMILAYLVGSQGFGLPRNRNSSSVLAKAVYCNDEEDSVILMNETETRYLVEVLANILHNRSKTGPGEYSPNSFCLKCVLFAIRCLLSHHLNQWLLATTQGIGLNTLLIKVLAIHTFHSDLRIDPEAAEHAAFSLYLLSNYGLKVSL